jgi:hypothetical protein
VDEIRNPAVVERAEGAGSSAAVGEIRCRGR